MPINQTIIKQDDSLDYEFTTNDFDLSAWKDSRGSVRLEGGRGASQKIEIQGHHYVLRHYMRGGLVARLSKDRYIWTGLPNCRPYREKMVVDEALRQQLPVPEVVAYRVMRTGPWYRAAIISRFIPNRGTLASTLYDKLVPEQQWVELGVLIKRMHQAGICHADLNANNILIGQENDLYLIDFDKAKVMPCFGDWAQSNLDRLLRSLKKIQLHRQMASRPFRFEKQNWKQLLSAYNANGA